MDLDLALLPTGTLQWRRLVDYAVQLGDLAEVDYLELKGSLPFAERSQRKRSAVHLSRAILGMANRMPDVAERHLSGHGVVLVGVEAGGIVGAEAVDGAVLVDALSAYVGDDGPIWDYHFIPYEDELVMAVVVQPPQWGDRIHTCRREYSDSETSLLVRDGDVFVRQPGKTKRAGSREIAALERRRALAPHTGAAVSVWYEGAFDRIDLESARGLVVSYVERVCDRLLAQLTPRPPSSGPVLSSVLGREPRSPEDFKQEVTLWRDACLELVDSVAEDLLRREYSRGRFFVRNESDRFLEGVRVKVQFEPAVLVMMGSDTRYCDHGNRRARYRIGQMLPKKPTEYGRQSVYSSALEGVSALDRVDARPSLSMPGNAAVTERDDNGASVSWVVGDLPPRDEYFLDEFFAVIYDSGHHDCVATERMDCEHEVMEAEIGASWRLTARGVDHVFKGTFSVQCAQDPGVYISFRDNGVGEA